MSWTIAVQGIRSELPAAIALATPSGQDDLPAERGEQVDAAKEAAKAILAATGRDNDIIAISLYGHANPEHGPREGWSNEQITVSVGVLTPAAQASAPADTSSDVQDAVASEADASDTT